MRAEALIAVGLAVAGYGWLSGSRVDWALVVPGAALCSAGVFRLRRPNGSGAGTPSGVAFVGLVFACIGVPFTVAPIVFFAVHDWTGGFITLAGLIVGPYFAFLGYALLWTAICGTTPPLSDRFGAAMRWSAQRLFRPL